MEWKLSGVNQLQADFGFYRVVISTDQNKLNNDINNSNSNNGYYATN